MSNLADFELTCTISAFEGECFVFLRLQAAIFTHKAHRVVVLVFCTQLENLFGGDIDRLLLCRVNHLLLGENQKYSRQHLQTFLPHFIS